jgi:hypothetical protein
VVSAKLRAAGWSVVLAQKRDDRMLSVTITASTADAASMASCVVIGFAGIADILPLGAEVEIGITPSRQKRKGPRSARTPTLGRLIGLSSAEQVIDVE